MKRGVIFTTALFVMLLFCLRASAQVTVDNVTPAPGPGSNVTSYLFPHTVGAGLDRLLIVAISVRDGNVAVSTVTYGSTALNRIGFQDGFLDRNRTEMWVELAPPSGTANVVIVMSSAEQLVATAISFNGVNQTTPLGSFAGANGEIGDPEVTVGSAAGDLVLDTITSQGDAFRLIAEPGQTEQWNTFSGAGDVGNVSSGGSTKAGATSVTMGWLLRILRSWTIVAVSIKSAGTPNVVLTKLVNPNGIQPPGTDLTYTVGFINSGSLGAESVTISDAIPANTDFKVGSETHNLGTTGLTVAVAYSNNGGITYTYAPVNNGGGAPVGYDRNVTNIRWTFTGSLSPTSPNNTGTVSFTVRIR